MDEGKLVWVPHPTDGYTLGCIKDIGSETVTVEPRNAPGKPITVPYDQAFPSEEYENKDVDDNCKFAVVKPGTIIAFSW